MQRYAMSTRDSTEGQDNFSNSSSKVAQIWHPTFTPTSKSAADSSAGSGKISIFRFLFCSRVKNKQKKNATRLNTQNDARLVLRGDVLKS